MSDKVREQFEAWESPSWSPEVRQIAMQRTTGNGYRNRSVNDRWIGWQASRAVALEEAAQMCDRRARLYRGLGVRLRANDASEDGPPTEPFPLSDEERESSAKQSDALATMSEDDAKCIRHIAQSQGGAR